MQADVAGLFPSTAIILRDSTTITNGRLAHTWAAAGTYACRLAYREGGGATGGAAIAGRAEEVGQWVLSLSGTLPSTALQAGDRATVDGTTYNVDTVHYTPGEVIAWRAMLAEGQ